MSWARQQLRAAIPTILGFEVRIISLCCDERNNKKSPRSRIIKAIDTECAKRERNGVNENESKVFLDPFVLLWRHEARATSKTHGTVRDSPIECE